MMEIGERIRQADAELPLGIGTAGGPPGRNGLGRALPASILLHVLAAALAVSVTMPGPTVSPPVIDLTLLAPAGVERSPVPAQARTGRPATAARAGAPLPSPSPPGIPRAASPEPDLRAKSPVAAIPAPPVVGAPSIGKTSTFGIPEGSRAEPSAVADPIGPGRSPIGVRSTLPSLPPVTNVASGGTSPTGPGRAIDLERSYAYLRDDIQRGIAYPPIARKMGWEGDVVVAFRILPDGSAGDIRVVRGSGFAVLDRNAVEAVRNASPFRNPPAEAEIVTPVVYRLTPR